MGLTKGLTKMSQLNASSWVNNSDPLLKSYREYGERGTVSKGRLALAATVNAVKTVAYTILSGFGLVIYAFSFGKIPNRPWQTVCLRKEMTVASVKAFFNLKPVMEKMRVDEARAFCRSFLQVPHPPSFFMDDKLLPHAQVDAMLATRLKNLNVDQLKEVLQNPYRGKPASEGEFLTKLYSLRKENVDPKRGIISSKIGDMQQRLYRESGMITCVHQEQTEIKIVLFRASRKEALDQFWPELRPQLMAVDKSEGISPLELTKEQYAFCAAFGLSHDALNPQNPVLPTPQLLTRMFALGLKKQWKDVVNQVESSCACYRILLEGNKRPFTSEETDHLFGVAEILKDLPLMKACVLYQKENHPAKTPSQVKELARQSFECMKINYQQGPGLNSADSANYLNCLLEDSSMEWLKGKEVDANAVISGISYVGNAAEMTTRFIEMSLTSGNLLLLKKLPVWRGLNPQFDERLTNAWQTCPNEAVKNEAMPSLYSLSSSTYTVPVCPKLHEAIFAHASNPATLAAAPEACEKVLTPSFNKDAVNETYGKANIELKPIVLARLQLAKDPRRLEKLRDACVDIILSNVGQYASIWLNEQSDLIAEALDLTKRKADWKLNIPGSNLACAKEGLALLQYSAAHPGTRLAAACTNYLLRSPNNAAYLTAVQAMDEKQKANFKLLADLYN